MRNILRSTCRIAMICAALMVITDPATLFAAPRKIVCTVEAGFLGRKAGKYHAVCINGRAMLARPVKNQTLECRPVNRHMLVSEGRSIRIAIKQLRRWRRTCRERGSQIAPSASPTPTVPGMQQQPPPVPTATPEATAAPNTEPTVTPSATATPTSQAPGMQSSIEQNGIIWSFDKPYPVGQFINGDWWVIGPVTITAISPAAQNGMHGWMVNISAESPQAFDMRINSYSSNKMPGLPYTAQRESSIVKVMSVPFGNGTWSDCAAYNKVCLLSASVLTVVSSAPAPDSFRPHYFGSVREYFSAADLRLELLASLDLDSQHAPSREEIEQRVGMPRLDFSSSSLSQAQYVPFYSVHPYGRTWGAEMAVNNAEIISWLSLNSPLEQKLPILYRMIQEGIDLYGARRILDTKWVQGGGGNGAGRLIPLLFAAMLLDAPPITETLANSVVNQQWNNSFWESEMYKESVNGLTVLWGSYKPYGGFDTTYWRASALSEAIARHQRDPYGYIDGGSLPPFSYQSTTALPTKYEALAFLIYPELAGFFPEQNVKIVRYADRWSTQGIWAQPDPCAPIMGRCIGGDQNGAICTYADAAACPGGGCAAGVCSGGAYAGSACRGAIFGLNNTLLPAIGPSPLNDCAAGTCELNPEFYGVTYGPHPQNSSQCVLDTNPADGIGRWPTRHGLFVNSNGISGNRRSEFGEDMWNFLRALNP